MGLTVAGDLKHSATNIYCGEQSLAGLTVRESIFLEHNHASGTLAPTSATAPFIVACRHQHAGMLSDTGAGPCAVKLCQQQHL